MNVLKINAAKLMLLPLYYFKISTEYLKKTLVYYDLSPYTG